jgi:hypothetical protein
MGRWLELKGFLTVTLCQRIATADRESLPSPFNGITSGVEIKPPHNQPAVRKKLRERASAHDRLFTA